jgi:hypothetical protein
MDMSVVVNKARSGHAIKISHTGFSLPDWTYYAPNLTETEGKYLFFVFPHSCLRDSLSSQFVCRLSSCVLSVRVSFVSP